MGYDPQLGDLVANNLDYESVVLGMLTYFDSQTYVVEWYDKGYSKHLGYYNYDTLRHMRQEYLKFKIECK
jgi:hypothetical protein